MDAQANPSRTARDYPAAFRAARRLLNDPHDTSQVFLIMRSLNGPVANDNLARLVETAEGRALLDRRVELVELFADPGFIASFKSGTVGAAYRSFLETTGYSADGLAKVSELGDGSSRNDAVSWMKRRRRDVHDIWHVLTGYKADESLGESALVAFSYAQLGGLGWAFIATVSALKNLRSTGGIALARAIFEGYRHGRRAKWLIGDDYETLLHEPLDAARKRLGIVAPTLYRAAQEHLVVGVGQIA